MPTSTGWRTALVTGASSGIGREIALQIAERGADVVVVARREDELRALAGEISSRYGRTIEVLRADLTERADLSAVERRVADEDRPVDLVVNNAGVGSSGVFHELSVEREDAQVRLNVLAVMRLSHAALAAMVPRRRGGLLNVSSLSGFQPLPRIATYSAGKAFVTTFSEALHEEARPHGVHVTVLCPGFTRTGFQGSAGADRSGIPDFAWLSTSVVARAGLDAVTHNDALCIPALGYRALAVGGRLLPRGALRRAAAFVTQQF